MWVWDGGGRWVQFVRGGGQMLVQVAKMPAVYASRLPVGLRLRWSGAV